MIETKIKGHWGIHPLGNNCYQIFELWPYEQNVACQVFTTAVCVIEERHEAKEFACLIATAPALLEILEAIVEANDDVKCLPDIILKKAKQTLAEAKGID